MLRLRMLVRESQRAIRCISQSREEGPVTSPCPPCALRRWLPSRNDPVLVPTCVIGRLGDSVSLTLARARGESGRLRVWWLCTLAAIVLLVSVVSIPVRAAKIGRASCRERVERPVGAVL